MSEGLKWYISEVPIDIDETKVLTLPHGDECGELISYQYPVSFEHKPLMIEDLSHEFVKLILGYLKEQRTAKAKIIRCQKYGDKIPRKYKKYINSYYL